MVAAMAINQGKKNCTVQLHKGQYRWNFCFIVVIASNFANDNHAAYITV